MRSPKGVLGEETKEAGELLRGEIACLQLHSYLSSTNNMSVRQPMTDRRQNVAKYRYHSGVASHSGILRTCFSSEDQDQRRVVAQGAHVRGSQL